MNFFLCGWLLVICLATPGITQTTYMVIGTFEDPIIYDSPINVPAPSRPWYRKFLNLFSSLPPLCFNRTFPPYMVDPSHCYITGWKLINTALNAQGLVRVVEGRLGSNNITVEFTAPQKAGIQYNVTVHGRCGVGIGPPILYTSPTASYYGWNPPINSNPILNSNVAQPNGYGW